MSPAFGYRCSKSSILFGILFTVTATITFHGLQRLQMRNSGSEKILAKGFKVTFDNPTLKQNNTNYMSILKVKKPEALKRPNLPSDYPKLPVVYLDKDVKDFSKLIRPEFRIPRIIHQTWINYEIPPKFVPLVKTWKRVNPDWEYWFWTDADADSFIKLKYPKYHQMYRNYPQNIHRADAMRYFILHEFGGLYVDMDVEALKSLDDLAHQHDCVIAQEPWPHTVLFWGKTRLACNALMAARPKHPFFKLVLEHLPSNSARGGKGEVMDKTGPKMIDRLVSEYEKLRKGHYFVNETLYLGNPDSFLPTIAENALRLVKQKCAVRQRNPIAQQICDKLKKNNYANKAPPEAITDHKWVHTYYGIDKKASENIFKIAPHAVNVKDMLEKMATSGR